MSTGLIIAIVVVAIISPVLISSPQIAYVGVGTRRSVFSSTAPLSRPGSTIPGPAGKPIPEPIRR